MAQSVFPISMISSGNGLRFFKGVPQLESRKLHFLGTKLPSQNRERLMTYQAPCVLPSGLRINCQVTKGGFNGVSLVPRKPNMNLSGKMMMHVEINSSGDVLYDIVRFRPNDLATILPDKVQGCYLLDGQWGAVGSIICWNFTYDGKSEVIKQEIEEVNDANHKIVFNVLEAKLVEGIYKSFKIIFYTEPDSNGKLAAVTFEFEKENSKMPYPTEFMDYLCDVFRGVDKYSSSKL